jgi:hypothetical protein
MKHIQSRDVEPRIPRNRARFIRQSFCLVFWDPGNSDYMTLFSSQFLLPTKAKAEIECNSLLTVVQIIPFLIQLGRRWYLEWR